MPAVACESITERGTACTIRAAWVIILTESEKTTTCKTCGKHLVAKLNRIVVDRPKAKIELVTIENYSV